MLNQQEVVMDKNFANLEIYSPGIVIFDPEVIVSFLRKNNIADDNLFDCFLADEDLGRAVIDEGVLIPIYQIPEAEYSVFLHGARLDILDGKSKFRYSGFPSKSTSGLLVVADLNALFDWDPDFFLSYKFNYESRLACNDYLDVSIGLYSVTIIGYEGLQLPLMPKGYGLTLHPVEVLPRMSPASTVDDQNFTL
jgi:hypothetical protein